MIYAAAILGVIAALLGFAYIEKRRKEGTLTYPLWRGNLFIPWAGLALVFVVLMGSLNLPRAIALAEHGVPAQAIVVRQDTQCQTTYRYTVAGREYTQTGSKCGLKTGDSSGVFYDPAAPESSTLYPPKVALKNELIAMGLIAFCLPTALVLWLMVMQVIGWRWKS